MLLQQIVETLDAELDRLHQLRSIVAEISAPVSFPMEAVPESVAPPLAVAVEALPDAPALAGGSPRRKLAGAPRGRPAAKRKLAVEASALNGSIPAGPVVVNAASVAQFHAAKQAAKVLAKPAEPVGTLGSMIRALHLQSPQ